MGGVVCCRERGGTIRIGNAEEAIEVGLFHIIEPDLVAFRCFVIRSVARELVHTLGNLLPIPYKASTAFGSSVITSLGPVRTIGPGEMISDFQDSKWTSYLAVFLVQSQLRPFYMAHVYFLDAPCTCERGSERPGDGFQRRKVASFYAA